MPVQELTAAEIEALVGTRHGVTGVEYPPNGLQPYYQWLMRSVHLLAEAASLSNGLRVSRDAASPTSVNVAPGRAAIDGVTVTYAGGTLDLAAHDDGGAFVWLTGGGVAFGSSGSVWPAVAHVKLAEVTLAGGAVTAILDRRAEGVSRPPLSLAGAPLLGGRFVRAFLPAVAAGDHDLPAVPAGKRWAVLGYTAAQTGGATSTHCLQLKVAGTYYRLTSNASLPDSTASTNLTLPGIALEAGDRLSVSLSGAAANTNFCFSIVEFDASVPVRSARVLALPAAESAVYTCPAGRSALVLDAGLNPNTAAGRLSYVNTSGGSQSVRWHAVPSGGSAAASNQITAAASVGNNVRSTANAAAVTLGAGDAIVVVTSNANAGQTAWVNVLEL